MKRSDRTLGLGMRKAIALLVIWGKRAIALWDSTWERLSPFLLFGGEGRSRNLDYIKNNQDQLIVTLRSIP